MVDAIAMTFPIAANASTRLPDAITHASLARITRGIAPLSVIGAYMDWATHLAASPGKQRELMQAAVREWTAWHQYVRLVSSGDCAPCVSAHPRDKRFADEAWSKIPFNWISQAFLVNERWWASAMTDVRGVSKHHEEVAAFTTRQWLDMWSPSNFFLTNPEVLTQTTASGGTNLLRGAGNYANDLSDYVLQRKPAGAENFIPGKTVAITPGKVIFRNRLMELIQYEASTSNVFPEPILIVPSWIMKYYILDLSPHNSLVKYLVDNGHTVFILSWKNPTSEDRELALDDYLKQGVLAAIEQIGRICPQQKIHSVGYCLGGTLLAMAVALLERQKSNPLETATLLASQVDFHDPGELGLFIDESQIAYIEDIMWERGYLDGKQMAGAFALIKSNDLVWSRLIREYLMGSRPQLTDMKAWNADATRMPYRMHSEYLRSLYLRNDFSEGRFEVDGKPIALQDVRLPMFVVSTEWDHVSPWRSVYKIHLLTDSEVTFVLSSGGHNVGVVNPPLKRDAENKTVRPLISYQVGVRSANGAYIDPDAWQRNTERHEGSWWPAFQKWLAMHSGDPIAPIAIGGKGKARVAVIEDAPGSYVHDV
jgi:polyhydroxyalkanoate synthase subunit PhaC